MKALVVAATKAELTFLYQHFNLQEGDFIEERNFDILITGVGMVATAYALGKHLSYKYNLVLNLGIAGCFDRQMELGSLVNITHDTFAELGAEDGENFLPITDLGFGENTFTSESRVEVDLPKVYGVTVNRVSGNEKKYKKLAGAIKSENRKYGRRCRFICLPAGKNRLFTNQKHIQLC